MRFAAVALVSFSLLCCGVGRCRAQGPLDSVHPEAADSDAAHHSAEWANIALHLPDIASASSARLEAAADVLRARRFYADAMFFYNATLQRGGDPQTLLKKMGITCLEMQQIPQARMYFERAVRLRRTDPSAWNNLGAAEFTLRNLGAAIDDYKHALRLEKTSAVFHSNLALAYFEDANAKNGRRELAKALQLDPELLHKSTQGGYNAQVLASTRYSEVCFEMARIYAAQGNVDVMLDWLTKASDRGFDIRKAMDRDPSLRPLLADVRVQVILKNTRLLRAGDQPRPNVPALGNPDR